MIKFRRSALICAGMALVIFSRLAPAQFVPGQVLTASQLNNQFSLYLPLAGGTLSGPVTIPNLTVTNGLALSSLASQSANTVLANATGSNATPAAFSMPSCSGSNNALRWASGSGFACAGSIALTSGTLSQFAVTTSTQLAGIISDETGSGSLVFGTNPIISGPTFTGSVTAAAGVFSGQVSLGGAAGAEALRAVTTASAVNWVQAQGGTTGNGATLSSQGSDSAVNLNVNAKGAASIVMSTGGGTQAVVSNTASANRYITLTGSNGGNPTIGASAGRIAISPGLDATPIGALTASTGAFTTLSASGSSGATSLAITGSSTPTSNLSTITDSLTGTVTGSFRPDTFFVNRTYNGSQSASGYTSAGDALHPYIGYGTTNTSTAGSVALLGGNINVYNSTNGPAGRSEFTPLAVAVVPIKGGTFSAGSNYYNDFNIQSAPGTGGQEGFLASGSFSVQKWTSGNTIDANHAGSYGLSVIATPNNTGYDAQNHASDTTYPLNAMITLNGWSGQQSTTSAGGSAAAATAAANVGLQIGGPGGSVWGCATCYSYIPTGIHIQDYTTAAIQIDSPNTGHTTTGTSININQGAGNLVVGDSIYVGTPTGGGTVQMAQTNVNAPVASTQAMTHYQDRGTDKWIVGKQTDNSFAAYDSANGVNFLAVSASGNTAVGEGGSTTTTINNPVASGTISGFVGRLLNVQIFSSSGTYTPTAGTAKIIVKVQAPGGSSGAVAATSTGQSAAASGGGAGSYAQALVTSGFSGVAVTVPVAPGAPAAGANNGTAGSSASFGSIVSCPGGSAGQGGAAVSSAGFTTAAGQASACTVSGATTILSVPGQASAAGWVVSPGTASMGGAGGSSPLGIARAGLVANGSGIGSTGYGAGGTGANNGASQSAAAGTPGGAALIEIDEYSN